MKSSQKNIKTSPWHSVLMIIPWLITIVAFAILGIRVMDPASATILMFSFSAMYFVTVLLIEENKMNDKAIAAIFCFAVVTGLGLWQINRINKDTDVKMLQIEDRLNQEITDINKTTNQSRGNIQYFNYDCKNGKKVSGLFSGNSVTVSLSDGRVFNLQRTVSADGERFASEDDNRVFWVKGSEARFDEDGKTIFENCNIIKEQ